MIFKDCVVLRVCNTVGLQWEMDTLSKQSLKAGQPGCSLLLRVKHGATLEHAHLLMDRTFRKAEF